MEQHQIDVSVCYSDLFVEVFPISAREVEELVEGLVADEKEAFMIGSTTFYKKDIHSVSLPLGNTTVFYTFWDET